MKTFKGLKEDKYDSNLKTMDGLSEKINEILESKAYNLSDYREKKEKLINRINFLDEHGFKEESRIELLKYNSMIDILSDYKDMFDALQKAVNNWNS